MLKIGTEAPDFSGKDQHGNAVTLGSQLERGKLVLYFYPKDFTPVCTAQACTFRDASAELADLGTNVVGVSGDTPESHVRFSEEHRVPFPLLADPERKILKAYDALGIFNRTRRVTYVIDVNRRIIGAFQHELSATKHMDDVRKLLAK